MDLDAIFSLMDRAEKSCFDKIEIEFQDLKLRLERGGEQVIPGQQPVPSVKSLPEKPVEVDDAELVALASHIVGQQEAKNVHLKEFAVFTGINTTPTAVVSIEVNGEKKTGTSIGIGPVDAAINAIKSVMGNDISLEEYRLSAITGGSDSLCEVTVRVARSGGRKMMSIGKAVGSDIVQTSVDATMEALDRLYCHKKEL